MFGDLGILSFVRISYLNLIGHVNRMNSTRKVSKVFESNPQGSRLRQGADGFELYVTFVIFTAIITRSFVFSGVTPCSLVMCFNISEEMCSLHFLP